MIVSSLIESAENTDVINSDNSQILTQPHSSHILVTKRKEYSAD